VAVQTLGFLGPNLPEDSVRSRTCTECSPMVVGWRRPWRTSAIAKASAPANITARYAVHAGHQDCWPSTRHVAATAMVAIQIASPMRRRARCSTTTSTFLISA
jgi:hypothetical protein